MKFTVTMECGECGQKFAGQDEHLERAVGNMVKSAYDGDHAHDKMNLELAALAQKAENVNMVDGVLTSLGLSMGEVTIIDLVDPGEPDAEA